ncbi:DUF4177 domain-containing protein [Clostridium sp. YIM B02506]|uniref:DUF4177 domain-containing protein n=1 Tax=Clostridium sp. YIM B02506 TaxID=2910680 RepID=UPI001EEE96A9|nr:DUF4177 domain-containing protein [Clostridium sp. YIM B02506]
MDTEWKYKVFTLDKFMSIDNNLTLEEKLNKYGQDGWELVGVINKQTQSLGVPSGIDSDSIILKKAYHKLKSNNYI